MRLHGIHVLGQRCFNPRARAGRDILSQRAAIQLAMVSIHAPARGATVYLWHHPRSSMVSIHAPARGATRTDQQLYRPGLSVSIHAPARGATFDTSMIIQGVDRDVSIHAPARGATAWLTYVSAMSDQFQSTRPRGARRRACCTDRSRCSRFNPRARAGRDESAPLLVEGQIVFQSTRPRGARRQVLHRSCIRNDVSIHAPARGATEAVQQLTVIIEVSIHAPARGATHSHHDMPEWPKQFQSTRPRGARHKLRLIMSTSINSFNPRARAGRDTCPSGYGTEQCTVSIHAPARGATLSTM